MKEITIRCILRQILTSSGEIARSNVAEPKTVSEAAMINDAFRSRHSSPLYYDAMQQISVTHVSNVESADMECAVADRAAMLAMRGIVYSLILSVPLWGIIICAGWLVYRTMT